MNNGMSRYSLKEEIASSVIHGVGILLSLIALVVMLYYAIRYGNGWHIAGALVFGCGLIMAYT